MQNYFKIPVIDGYININTTEDTPIDLIYDNAMEFGYVLLDFKTAKPNWEEMAREEFEAKKAELLEPPKEGFAFDS